MWLDIPYAQIDHSDVFVLVRVGVSRSHFVAFLKEISVIRDKMFSMAEELDIKFDRDEIWGSLPNFTNIPAFIVGFFDKSAYAKEIQDRSNILEVDGYLKQTRKGQFRAVLNRFIGWWNPKDPEYKRKIAATLRKRYPGLPVDPEKLIVEFEGLGEPSETLHFFVTATSG